MKGDINIRFSEFVLQCLICNMRVYHFLCCEKFCAEKKHWKLSSFEFYRTKVNRFILINIWFYYWSLTCSRKNFKLLFCAGIALAVGVRIYIFHPRRMADAILPRSPPRGNIKARANHFSPSLRLLAAGQASNMTEHILSLCFLSC